VATRAIFGLGNPGPRYAATRHNAGFLVVERLVARHGLRWARNAAGARIAEGWVAGSTVLVAQPLEFMNRSGEVVAALVPGESDPATHVLVVHDELDLPFGRLKLKLGGGTAGHRGLRSIAEELGDRPFCRLRVGIGRPPAGIDPADFVLSDFGAAERERLPTLLDEAADGCEAWLALGLQAAMNRVNARPPAEPADAGPPEPSREPS